MKIPQHDATRVLAPFVCAKFPDFAAPPLHPHFQCHPFGYSGASTSATSPLPCDVALKAALTLNEGVAALLLREASIDGAFPSSAGAPGSEEEAVAVASSLFDLWQLVRDAMCHLDDWHPRSSRSLVGSEKPESSFCVEL